MSTNTKEQRSCDKLAEALQPFVLANSSDEHITLVVRTADVTRAREVLAAHDAEQAQAKRGAIDNPWRASLENCISGDNYLRASEYRELIAELDELYRLRAAPTEQAAQAVPADSEGPIADGWQLSIGADIRAMACTPA